MKSHYIWPLSKSSTPDKVNTSFGPRIDADKWDFHDEIDLPAPVGTSAFAMQTGKIFGAGPGEPDKNRKGIRSRHVIIETKDAFGDSKEALRLDWDTAGIELRRFRAGIASIPAKASCTMLCDELRLTEDTLWLLDGA